MKLKNLLIVLLASIVLYAQNDNPLNFILPQNDRPQKLDSNKTSSANVSDVNDTDENETNAAKETNQSVDIIQTQDFNATFATIKPSIDVAIVINKKKFFKYLPSLMNSLIAYFDGKSVDYNLSLYSIDSNLSKITRIHKNVLFVTADKNKIYALKDYNATFYVPTFNAKDFNQTFKNVIFGGINYENQIRKLSSYMDENQAVSITENKEISKKLLNIEKDQNISLVNYEYPYIDYQKLNDSYVFFNTTAGNTAQILAKITYDDINTKLQFAAQIDYDPLLLAITQAQNVQKLIIANSIIFVPERIEDYDLLLGSDIKYNWLNYSSSILANKIYNDQTQGPRFFVNDFNLYIFLNQINYKTKLYQIINRKFTPINQ
jgi:hypothetical protein